MKKILYPILVGAIVSLSSCQSDDKNIFLELEKAPIVTMHINNEDISLSGTNFNADVDAHEDVIRHEIVMFQQSVNDTVAFATYTEFPFQLTITREDIASALSIDVNDIEENDKFNFLGTSTAEDGTVYTIADFDITGFLVSTPEMQFNSNAYEFSITIME